MADEPSRAFEISRTKMRDPRTLPPPPPAAPTLPGRAGSRSDSRAAPRPVPPVPSPPRGQPGGGGAPPTPALTPAPRGGGSGLTDPGGYIDEVEAGRGKGEEEDEGEHGAVGDAQHLPQQWHPPTAPAAGRSAQSRRAAAALPRERRPAPPMDRAARR